MTRGIHLLSLLRPCYRTASRTGLKMWYSVCSLLAIGSARPEAFVEARISDLHSYQLDSFTTVKTIWRMTFLPVQCPAMKRTRFTPSGISVRIGNTSHKTPFPTMQATDFATL